MAFMLYFLLLSGITIVHSELAGECQFSSDRRTYICDGITEKFPSMFYGSYHLKCINCHLPIFNAETFPVHASLISFNLSNSGIQNISSGSFADLPMLQYLYLDNNRIFGLSKNAFTNLRQLYELDLQHNELFNLTSGSFSGLESVSVSLGHNRIKEVAGNAFEGVLGVMALNLSYNQIGILSPDSFKGLDNLEILDLRQNKICYIPLGIFKHIQMVKDLNLSSNKIRSFTIGTFSGLVDLLTLNLAHNEFSEFDASALLPLGRLSNLDISKNSLFYLDSHSLHMNAPTVRILKIYDNLWSCTLLTNMVQFFKSVNVDTSENIEGRFNITNVNGVGCSMEPLNRVVPFTQFLTTAAYYTNLSINYC